MKRINCLLIVIVLIFCCYACAKQSSLRKKEAENTVLATFVPEIGEIDWENLPDSPRYEIQVFNEALNRYYKFYFQDYCADSDATIRELASITPMDAAQCAAENLFRQIGTDIGLLTVTIRLNDQTPVYTVLAPDADGITPKYQCNIDGKTGQMLELLNLTFMYAKIGNQNIDRADPTIEREEKAVLEAVSKRVTGDLLEHQSIVEDTYISDVISFQYEDYSFICFCKVHIENGTCYTIAVPCPTAEGDIYQIKYYPDGWESCVEDKTYLYSYED